MLTHSNRRKIKLKNLFKILTPKTSPFYSDVCSHSPTAVVHQRNVPVTNIKERLALLTERTLTKTLLKTAPKTYENELVVELTFEREQILSRDMYLLQNEDQRINSNIINVFCVLMQNHIDLTTNKNIKLFECNFFTKLLQDGYDYLNVYKYQKQSDIFALDMLLTPVYVDECHFALICVIFSTKSIYYIDSMDLSGTQYLMDTLKWLFERHVSILGTPLDIENWSLYDHAILCGPQRGSVDCGVFCLMFIDCLCHDVPINWIKQDSTIIKPYRNYVLLSLAANELLTD